MPQMGLIVKVQVNDSLSKVQLFTAGENYSTKKGLCKEPFRERHEFGTGQHYSMRHYALM
jgi:hypothetical protein